MKQNPQIAFVLGGINIEAIAEIYGHPGTYPDYMKIYGKRYPEYVQIIAEMQKISVYNHCGGKACWIYLGKGHTE